ncbi:MAG TPA: hypothetical protein VGR62_04785 [Candidatus Binatia bacterium]|nr:hypothetical protein [Candidatus Binatia bacterium]
MRPVVALLVLAAATSASAAFVPQQRGTPCDAAWDVGSATARPAPEPRQPWDLVCRDGDPACDLDNEENGECMISIGACAAVTTRGCTPRVIRKVVVPKSTRKVLPGLILPPTRTAGCGTPGTLTLPITDPANEKAGVLLTLRSGGRKRGSSRLRVRCVPLPPARSVEALSFIVPSSASDFDYGFSGNNHNFPMWTDERFEVCLTGCDDTTDAVCDVGVCVPQTLTPIPFLSNGVPVCLTLQMTDGTAPGTFDLASGALSLPVTLRADVHVQTPYTVCPRCSGDAVGARGTCSSGGRQGEACTVEARVRVVNSPSPDYFLSADCPPDAAKLAVSIPIAMTLTTGEAALAGSHPCPAQDVDDACGMGTCTVDCSDTIPSRGGINQICCSNSPATACFPTAADSPPGRIVRNGIAAPLTPAWPAPTASRKATGTFLAATFCLPRTSDQSVDILAGLPGPGALLLPVDIDVHTTIVAP